MDLEKLLARLREMDAHKVAAAAGLCVALCVTLFVWALSSSFTSPGAPPHRHVEAVLPAQKAPSWTDPTVSPERRRQAMYEPFERSHAAWQESSRRSWQASNRRFDQIWALFGFLFALSVGVSAAWFVWTLLRKANVAKHKPDVLAEQATAIADRLSTATPIGTSVVLGGFVHDRALSISTEDRAVVLGPPGTGKTSFLVSQLLRWAEQKRSFICLDIKPEIYGLTRVRLAELGYQVLTYNPTEGTGQRYNILDDIESPEGLGELAAALIPGEQEDGAVFYESARDFLDAIVSHLRATMSTSGSTPSLVDVRTFLGESEGYKELLQTLMASPDPDVRDIASALSVTASNPRLIGSIFALFRSNLRFARYPNVRASMERSDFSLRELCTDRPTALFLQFEEKNRQTTAHLLTAMVAHVMRFFIIHHDRPPVLLLLDEIGTAPVIPALVQKLNTIRSRHLPTWLYFQSLEQMQPYGETKDQGPNLILGACDMQMVFRLNDNASAQWMSERVGVVDRTVESVSVQVGTTAHKSRTLVTEPLLWPHQLQALAPHEVICTYRGQTWRGTATPYYQLWPPLQGQRPQAADLRGQPYPTPLQVVTETG